MRDATLWTCLHAPVAFDYSQEQKQKILKKYYVVPAGNSCIVSLERAPKLC